MRSPSSSCATETSSLSSFALKFQAAALYFSIFDIAPTCEHFADQHYNNSYMYIWICVYRMCNGNLLLCTLTTRTAAHYSYYWHSVFFISKQASASDTQVSGLWCKIEQMQITHSQNHAEASCSCLITSLRVSYLCMHTHTYVPCSHTYEHERRLFSLLSVARKGYMYFAVELTSTR
jgi:hypothetical protein